MFKLKAYQVGAPLEMRPANPKREWMDSANSKNPYRCLPLSMANGFGWEFINPSKFSLEWDGGRNPKDVKLIKHSGSVFPDNHFGEGTFTWHTGYLFRTEYPYGIYVSGPPNYPKHNVIPLSGIVETHWIPFTFTMNWRFTQPGRVDFLPGEVICQIFPIDLTLFDNVEPEIHNLSEDPEYEEKYWQWNVSRTAFSLDKTRGDTWQKDYFQGKYAQLDEVKGCPFHVQRTLEEEQANPHRTKPNVPEFKQVTDNVHYPTPDKYNKIIKKLREDAAPKTKTTLVTTMEFKPTKENTLPDIAEKINNSDKLMLLYVTSTPMCNNDKPPVQEDLEKAIQSSYIDRVDYTVMCIPEKEMPFPKVETDVLYFFAPKNQTPLFFRDRYQIMRDLQHDVETALKMIDTGANYYDAKFDDATKNAIFQTEEYIKKEDTSKFPSPFQMARNLAKEMWRTGKNASKGLPILVSAEVGFARFATCEGCEHFEKDSSRCTQCGCFMKTKTQLASASCPVGKWSSTV